MIRNVDAIEICARAAHEAVRAHDLWCGANAIPWDACKEATRQSVRDAAGLVLEGKRPQQVHLALVPEFPYEELGEHERRRYEIFVSTVRLMAGAIGAGPRTRVVTLTPATVRAEASHAASEGC